MSPTVRRAIIPLDPDLVARLERTHRDYFKSKRKSKRSAARAAPLKRQHRPANVLGGYQFENALRSTSSRSLTLGPFVPGGNQLVGASRRQSPSSCFGCPHHSTATVPPTFGALAGCA
jgi:hypothetical protein